MNRQQNISLARPRLDSTLAFLGRNDTNELLNIRQGVEPQMLGSSVAVYGRRRSHLGSETVSELLDVLIGQSVIAQRVPDPALGLTVRGEPVLFEARTNPSGSPATKSDLASKVLEIAARGPLLNELKLAVEGAQFENWDGCGGRPASREAYDFAVRFALMLPPTFPDPEPSVDSDGDISFEWYRGPRRVFAVSVNSYGTLHYAGLFGANSSNGAEALSETLPAPIALCLARIL